MPQQTRTEIPMKNSRERAKNHTSEKAQRASINAKGPSDAAECKFEDSERFR